MIDLCPVAHCPQYFRHLGYPSRNLWFASFTIAFRPIFVCQLFSNSASSSTTRRPFYTEKNQALMGVNLSLHMYSEC
jgi:hypothetical protein